MSLQRPRNLIGSSLMILTLLALPLPARADVPIRIDVTYSTCGIVEGPLSLGLEELPEAIHATFVILAPTWPPLADVPFDPQVLFASLVLGDLRMTAEDLQYFTVAFSYTVKQELTLSMLTYLGLADDTDGFFGIDVANSSFEINITGTDTATGEPFHYQCTTSSQTFAEVSSITVPIDVKPGSCPNAFEPGSRGALPVALMTDGLFSPDDVDPSSLSLARADGAGGLATPLLGPRGPRIATEDVATPFPDTPCGCHELEGDGTDDLSVKFGAEAVSEALELANVPAGEDVELVLRALLLDGTLVEGRDCIRLSGRLGALRAVRRATTDPIRQVLGHPISRVLVHPNPASRTRTIAFELEQGGPTRVEVFDVHGRQVAVPFDGELAPGTHQISWNTVAGRGPLPSGVYFARVTSGGDARAVRFVELAP